MTPATQREIRFYGTVHPKDVIVDGGSLTWSPLEKSAPPQTWSITTLLDDFADLERATDDEMATFVSRYGLPEVSTSDDRDRRLSINVLRRAARGVAAARRVGAALTTRRHGALEDWMEMQHVLGNTWVVDPDDWDDWVLGRERFAEWITWWMREAGVTNFADWRGSRGLSLEPESATLFGVIAILVSREIGSEGMYECAACGTLHPRRRAPLDGESVYCDRPTCKREQQRRNQAAWRAKKRAEGGAR